MAAPAVKREAGRGLGRDAMTYPRGIAYHEAGHAVVGWSLNLQVRVSRVFYDDVKGWQGDTDMLTRAIYR